jgi:hypothetical protein
VSYLVDTNVLSELRRMRLNDWLEVDLPTFFTGRMQPLTVAGQD